MVGSLLVMVSKYLMMILTVMYTFFAYFIFFKGTPGKQRNDYYKKQTILIYLVQCLGYLSMYALKKETDYLVAYLFAVLLITAIQFVFRFVYLNASVMLVNNMSMLLMTGLMILTRLDLSKANRMLLFGGVSIFVTAFFPFILKQQKNRFRKLKWIYASVGIGLLTLVFACGSTTYGAKISLSIACITVQPSEFVKLSFVFFIAAMLSEAVSLRQIMMTSCIAAVHVLILAASRDLGGAFIYFFVYLMLVYAAVKKTYVLLSGSAFVVLILFAAEKLFTHVKSRVIAWQDPLSVIDNQGYQVSQSLFAIGSGGWFGSGLFQGKPETIPVVAQDFVFSAISEELGGIYAICLIFICFSSLLMFFYMASNLKDRFYRYVSIGLGSAYGIQTFLTIGGAIRFIPSTGVTLPLVSYGGSSLFASFMMFGIIQGLFITQNAATKKVSKKKQGMSGEIKVIIGVFFACFMGLAVHFCIYMVKDSESFINNSYNKRIDSMAQTTTRGMILSSDGEILAQTITDENGTETRSYPYGRIFAHTVGFSTNGKSGIESDANFYLLRSHSLFTEKIANEMSGEKNTGDNVILTIDTSLQIAAYNALGNHDGAVVVLRPSDGAILAMVSKPDFDPNTIKENWDDIISDTENSSLLNRASQGLYPPGSTFKILTALEYFRENGVDADFIYQCDGGYSLDGKTIRCYNGKAHGKEDLSEAFYNSCNAAFAKIGTELNTAEFNDNTKDILDKLSEVTFELPCAKSRFSIDMTADTAKIMETAIGQGDTLMTPLQMALLTSAISNDGKAAKPYLLSEITSSDGITIRSFSSSETIALMEEEEAHELSDLMRGVVLNGTATQLQSAYYQAYGKTGTAEFNEKGDSHAWFTGFTKNGTKDDIVVVVLMEDAGVATSTAVPAVRQILDTYYALQ